MQQPYVLLEIRRVIFVYLGIASDGKIVGLEKDRNLEKFANYEDEFANHVQTKLNHLIREKPFILDNLQMEFRQIDGKTICLIQVLQYNRPLFLYSNNFQKFYVRGIAPRAEELVGIDQNKYIKNRFPNL